MKKKLVLNSLNIFLIKNKLIHPQHHKYLRFPKLLLKLQWLLREQTSSIRILSIVVPIYKSLFLYYRFV
jgi:hypothetical protein